MAKVLVVYATTTGNTEKMADAIVEGAKGAGADVTCKAVADASVADLGGYDVIAFGSPAMGAEVLEDSMEEFFASATDAIKGKKVAVFGSYDWGDGEWLRTWEDRVKEAGATVAVENLKAHLEPDDDAIAECKAWGAKLA